MVYIDEFILPSEASETGFIKDEKRTCFHTFYPFKIFPMKGLRRVRFDGITMFYGGNGSGKSTLINVIAEKVGALRFSEFNDAPFFRKYLEMCRVEYFRMPPKCYVLTSDDVFDYVLNARTINGNIDDKREALFEQYSEIQAQVKAHGNTELMRLKGMDDFDRWKETMHIISPKRSQSQFIRDRVPRDVDLCSNGETALRYFFERIEEDAVYFLDEPENSLSVEFQLQLADYIAATARTTRSQFIIATHSPILLSMSGAAVYNLDAYPAGRCDWTELPNVRRYFDFFMKHKDEFE